ncbi:MAG: acyltransferase family protein [Sulfitobacter sp.]
MAPKPRYHGLDALRAFAMLLGLVLHASQVYLRPDFLTLFAPWVSLDAPASSDLTGMTAIWIHLWRMPVFFLLAGFFAQMSIERGGAFVFLKDRFIRIFVTLAIAGSIFSFWRGYPVGTLAHLWFLWILVSLSLIAPLTARLARPWIFERPSRLLLLIPVFTVLGMWNRDNIWQDIPDAIWDPEFSAFAMYGAYFVLGQMLWSGRAVIDHLQKRIFTLPLIFVGFVAYILLGIYYYADMPNGLRQMGVAIASLCFCFGLIGAAERRIQRPNRVVMFCVESAYFIYIVHIYIVYDLSAWAVQMQLPQTFAIYANTITGFAISAALYLVFVRYTPVNWLLAGYRKSWFKLPFAPNGWPGTRTNL